MFIVNAILAFVMIVTMYPFILIISYSFSNAVDVMTNRVWLLPVRPNLEAYKAVFESGDVIRGYLNSILYTVGCTFFGTGSTLLAAYPLSRQDLRSRNILMGFVMVTMFFSGGLVPTYILVGKLGLTNTRWILIIGGVTAYNIIITRTFFQQTIPKEMLEAAQIDGCGDFHFFLQMVLPLSKAIIAVIALYVAVSRWNGYLDALMYMNDKKLYPLQLILREILIMNKPDNSMFGNINASDVLARQQRAELLKYALIVVSSIPMLVIYPFVQKYFIKGVMIGAIKG